MLAFRTMSRLAIPFACLALLLAAAPFDAPSAAADERVPMIQNRDLPALGTLAPIARQDVTHVRVGKRDDIRWFAVLGVEGVVDYPGLVRILKARAGAKRPSSHGVWLTATSNHAWAHALVVVKACAEAGIYRVGVRARSETTGRALGFPLFIPAAPTRIPGPKAGRLDIRVEAKLAREVKGPSTVGHVYAAARRANEQRAQFGVEKVVAKVWLSPNTPLQYALSTIDLLYRGGVDGVQVQMSLRASWRGLDVVPRIEIQGAVIKGTPVSSRPPAVQPRERPWGIDGANAPGWVDFQVSDLPAIDVDDKGPTRKKAVPRPNYAASPRGVPAGVAQAVDEAVRRWALELGVDMNQMIRDPRGISPTVQQRFSVAMRRPQVLPKVVSPVRTMFPDATGAFVSTLRLQAHLFHQGKIQGTADVTLGLTGPSAGLVFGAWAPRDPNATVTLAPFDVDPYVAGDAAAFRVWLEDLFHQMKTRPVDWLPKVHPRAEVLRYVPDAAAASTQQALAARREGIEALRRAIRATPFDRLVLTARTGTAAITGKDSRVIGTLTMRFEPQEGELRINGLTPRRGR